MSTSPTEIAGANVRAEMARKKVFQAEVATHLGLSQTGVSNRLNGRVPFDINELTAIAELLGVEVDVFLPRLVIAMPPQAGKTTSGKAGAA